MKNIKIYLDTSVWNFVYADDAPEKRDVTIVFYTVIEEYDIYISEVVLLEIDKAPVEIKKKLYALLAKHEPAVLEHNNEVEILADYYIEKGIIPESKYDDALHIAYATFYEIDVLLSWNYKHLANIHKKKLITIANLEQGYAKPLELTTPMEVLHEED